MYANHQKCLTLNFRAKNVTFWYFNSMNFSAKNSQIAIILILVLGAKIQIAALFCTQYSKAVK